MHDLRFLPLAVVATCCFFHPLAAQNDKQVLGDAVLSPEEIAAGATVTYFIRFQNVGLDTAQQVVVRDTLDPRLDPASFDMVAASHEYELLREGPGDVLRWYFNDIVLPDSATDESGSLGFILFTIQPKPFLAPGQVISNQACITFNEGADVLCTNEAFVWLDDGATAAEPATRRDVRVVPNPNHGQFEVRHFDAASQPIDPRDTEWWITDIHGKTVWEGAADTPAAAGNQVLLEKPSPGLYLLWIKEAGRLQVEQFAVVR